MGYNAVYPATPPPVPRGEVPHGVDTVWSNGSGADIFALSPSPCLCPSQPIDRPPSNSSAGMAGCRPWALKIGWTLALAGMTGCSLLTRDTPTPIPTLARPLAATGRTSTLIVWLPGRGNTLADFDREGLGATLREAGVAADVIVIDAHLGYYYQ